MEDKGIDIEEAAAERARQAQKLSKTQPDADFSWVDAAEGRAYTKPPGTGPYGVGPPAVRDDGVVALMKRSVESRMLSCWSKPFLQCRISLSNCV